MLIKCRLSKLLKNHGVNDTDTIVIYDSDGDVITAGKWYQDGILSKQDKWGLAQIGKDGISFKMV